MQGVFVGWGCHKNILVGLKQQTFFSHSSGGWKSKTKGQKSLVFHNSSSSGLQISSFCLCPFMALSVCIHTPGLSLSYLIRTPALLTHLTLITSLKAPSPNTVILGVRASTQEFEGNTIQSITQRERIVFHLSLTQSGRHWSAPLQGTEVALVMQPERGQKWSHYYLILWV